MRAFRNKTEKEMIRILVEGNGRNERQVLNAIEKAKKTGGSILEGSLLTQHVNNNNEMLFSIVL